MKAIDSRVSYADLERWPEDGRRYELYDGEAFEIPSPIALHQMVSARLFLALHLINPRKVSRHPPDLAVEILSPGTVHNDRGRKRQLLATHGVREYWLVDPEGGAIEVYQLSGDRLMLASRATGDEHVQSLLLPRLRVRPCDLVPAESD